MPIGTALALLVSLEAAGSRPMPSPADSVLVCLAPPTAQMVGGRNAETVAAVQQAFTEYLTGPTMGVVALKAKLPSQAREEAKRAGCGTVLFTTVKHQRGDPNGLLGKVAGRIESSTWRVAATTRSAATKELAQAAAATAHDVAGSVKSKDQVTLEYRLESAAGAVLAKGDDSEKADSDGDDILTPLIEKAAEAVAAAASAPR